jgi:hypothetical protein
MKPSLSVFLLATALTLGSQAAALTSGTNALGTNDFLPGLEYHPEGDAIVISGGRRWNNRPLYCNARQMVFMVGEMPGVSGPLGTIQGGVKRGETSLKFEEFSQRVMRYRPGRMEWELSDPKFEGLALKVTVTTVAEGDGIVIEVRAGGAKLGDELLWYYFPREVRKGIFQPVKVMDRGFLSGPAEAILGEKINSSTMAPLSLCGGMPPSPKSDPGSKTNPFAPADQGNGIKLSVPLENQLGIHYLAIFGAGVKKPLDPEKAFRDGIARVTALGRTVEVETPDPYFNAGVGASCAAMYGLYVAPYFVHGGVQWRGCFPGWRVMDGATAYGWHDAVVSAAKYHTARQIKLPDGRTNAEADKFGAEQSTNSCFWGQGRIPSDHYDMQTQFFDQCVRDWRHTGDLEFGKLLLPMLELHLDWAKRCFDPQDQGLYESYINTWPTDSVWYNGGGTVEESSYIYHQQKAAADLCRLAGRTEDATRHDAEAEKIAKALNSVLWLPEKGQYGAYVEQKEAGGTGRVHDDAWIYSEHLPIEAGMATPLQAWQAMDYTDRTMEHYKFPYGGEMRQTSDWVPGQWSIRELFGGDNFAMALGYFLSGQGDAGWELLKGAMLESMYGDPTVKAGYGNLSQHISPGGLSNPRSSIDFNDVTSMFCRAVVEGLFGYQPDYPNGVVKVAPSLPSTWDHASIKTPDYSMAFQQRGEEDHYTISLKRPAKIRLLLPIRAERVLSVTADGKPLDWKIEPWAGYGMLKAELPKTTNLEVFVKLERRTPQIAPLTITKRVDEEKDIPGLIDPQRCLAVGGKPGRHLAFAKVERGNVPYLQVYKVEVTDPVGESVNIEKNPRQAPIGATWSPVGMTNIFNGDIREIFQQKYLSPRPKTVSCRIGYDGWSAWTFKPWHYGVPKITLDKIASLTGRDGLLVTPQGAEFTPVKAGNPPVKNIAFTSLWDNWPRKVTVPVNKAGDAVWLLICGNTNPMQGRIANAIITFRYADGSEEQLELIPPLNFWSLSRFGSVDYDYKLDGFALPKEPPLQVQLGANCRAMVYGRKLRKGLPLKEVILETVSQEVVIGLMGVSIMNPN